MATGDQSSIQLAWLDANVFSDENTALLKQLREMFTTCMEFTEADECKRFLGRGVYDPRRFILLVSGQLGEDFVPDIHDHSNVLSIHVYCGNEVKHKAWSAPYRKVKVVTVLKKLLSNLKSDKDRFEND